MLQQTVLVIQSSFDLIVQEFLLLVYLSDELLGLAARNAFVGALDNLLLDLLLFLLELQSLYPLGLVLAVHLLLDGTLRLLLLVLHEQTLVVVEYLLHLPLEIQKLVTFYRFVIFDPLRVQHKETADHLVGRHFCQLVLDLVVQNTLCEVLRQLQLAPRHRYNCSQQLILFTIYTHQPHSNCCHQLSNCKHFVIPYI